MSIPSAWPQVLDFFGTPLVIELSSGQRSGDAGLLPIRQFHQHTGLTRASADALDDARDPQLGEHTLLEMVRSRIYGILARRIVIRLSSSWPHLNWYFRVCERARDPLPIPVPDPSG